MRRVVATSLAALLLASCGQGDSGNNTAAAPEAESNLSAQGAPLQDLGGVLGSNARLVKLV